MFVIRCYRKSDIKQVTRIIREGFLKFLLTRDPAPGAKEYWLERLSARKSNLPKREAFYSTLPISFVAVKDGKVVGLAMGRRDELVEMFITKRYHGDGIGRRLLQRFEHECARQGSNRYRIRSSLHAVPFYLKMGCKKTTGVRNFRGVKVLYMKKIIPMSE
jgi:GNAT superfamily N-acetyltransferase